MLIASNPFWYCVLAVFLNFQVYFNPSESNRFGVLFVAYSCPSIGLSGDVESAEDPL